MWYTLSESSGKGVLGLGKGHAEMENIDGLTLEEIKELILEQLREIGLDAEAVEVEVRKGPSVVLSGAVESAGDKYLIKKTIMDIDGIDDLVDELVILDEPESFENEGDIEQGGLLNRDGDETLTEDAFEAMEDGIPYIPPDRPLHDEMSSDIEWKKNRKKRK